MPHHAKGDVILRQWEMLRLIPAADHPGKSAAELAHTLDMLGYSVTRRTVERDLENLQRGLPLACNTDARPQRWRWQKQRAVDIPGMEAAEAMALFMMHDAMAAHLPSCFLDALQRRFTQANTTLKALARSGSRIHWADRVRVVPSHVVLKPPRIAPKVVELLQRALLNDIAVEADYQSHQDAAPRRRLLYPRGLILRSSSLYLIAHQKNGDPSPHHYAVQRFANVRLRELEPWPEGAFSLETFLKDGKDQFGDGREIRLRARISPELNKILRDTPLSSDMHIGEESGGIFGLTATVRDTWSLHTWILGHAHHIEIEQPAALRQLVAQRLKAAAAQYA
jgi:predicted DNA-binding transcriptional regulator YafY